ncbi:MAG: phage holin family protein [Flavobacteriales bacterium]|nr:phage holin family protein [Flavobacteriales bacterium]MCB0812172.1 phage holin family protein [Flavobacteriales bacterium]MCB9180401.1 phage holin family protein [Flavobacteriales bacterium]
MNLLVRLIIATLAVLITDLLLPGVSLGDMGTTNGLITALLVAAVLGLLNSIVRPILIFLTLPVTLVTLGLFILVINAAMVLLADRLIDGFTVNGFWWALAFSVVQWLVQGFLNTLDGGKSRRSRES